MARYTLQNIIVMVVTGRQRERKRKVRRGRIKYGMVLMVSLAVAVLITSSASSAAPYYRSSNSPTDPELVVELAAQYSLNHAEVLAAGFGFQAAGFSMITVRTYDVVTGTILSEDSFDVNVREEGVAEHDGNKGRIFAGGIGDNRNGKSTFMLRVYDAETGRFLWEGQMNLLKVGEAGTTMACATIIPNRPSAVQTTAPAQKPVQTFFSVRAVNPLTGGLVWQDQFSPGIRKRARVEGVSIYIPLVRPVNDPIGHIFDLVVRTYDRTSGKLLWEDSFEQLDRIEDSAAEPETNAYPQAIPFWRPSGEESAEIHHTALH